MSARKPVRPNCTGGVWCPVEGHVVRRSRKGGVFVISHLPLTVGQRKTISERRTLAS